MAEQEALSLDASQAYSALEAYAERYGRLSLLLLAHVAVPQSFRAELVNLTKVNFLPEAGDDLTVDADVLFSPLVNSQGAGFYRLDREVRHQCLILLDAVYRHGPERRRVSVARFLLAYLDDLDRRPQSSEDPLLAEYIDVERHLAAAIIDPAGAAERIARALKSLTEQRATTRVHFTEMATALSVPLAGYPELLAYARGVGALQSGNEEEAERVLARLGGGTIRIGDVTLRPDLELLRDTYQPRVQPTTVKQTGSERSPSRRDVPPKPPDTEHRFVIYVTCARVDDEPIPPAEPGWVSVLLDNLDRLLAMRLGGKETYSIWYDRQQLRPDNSFAGRLVEQVKRSDLLLVILSPGWTASAFCLREFEAFTESHLGSVAERLFIIERMPVNDSPVPDAIRELRKYRFYRVDENGIVRTFAQPRPLPDDREYFARIDDLAHDITGRLRSIDAQSPGPLKTSKPALFLAEVTDDLETRREDLRRFVEQSGIEVLPRTPYPLVGDEFERSMEADIVRCALFVQLLGPLVGKRPPEVPNGFGWLQYEVAQRARVPVLQWRAPDLHLSNIDDTHRRLLELETVHAATFEEFKRTVRHDFVRLLSPPPMARGGGVRRAFIFINADSVDRASAERIGGGLGGRFDWAMPLSLADPSAKAEDILMDLESNFIDADGIIIVYGAVRIAWVTQQLRLYRKLAPRRSAPPRLLALVTAPPLQKAALPISLPGLTTIEIDRVPELLEQTLSE